MQGGVASAAACVISNPIDIARAQMQVGMQVGIATPSGRLSSASFSRGSASFASGGSSSASCMQPPSTLSALRGLARSGGLLSGLGPAIGYNLVFNAGRFACFDALTHASSGAYPLASGFAAGLISGWLASPLARARTLLQVGGPMSTVETLCHRPFAAAPSWALRNAAHTSIIFSLFELGRRRLETDCPNAPISLLHLAASASAAAVSSAPSEPFPGHSNPLNLSTI